MPVCEGCGYSYDDSFKFCPQCGRVKPEPKDIKVMLSDDSSDRACPSCRRIDKVEKVTEIRRHQIQHLNGTIPVSHSYADKDGKIHSYSSHENFSGTQTSQLADTLCPPTSPKIPKTHSAGTWWLLGLLIYPGLLWPLFIFSPIVADINILPAMIFGGIGIPVWIILFSKWKGQYNREEQHYPTLLANVNKAIQNYQIALKNWNQLYYCYRDGCVFIPGKDTSAPIEKMMEYIYNE